MSDDVYAPHVFEPVMEWSAHCGRCGFLPSNSMHVRPAPSAARAAITAHKAAVAADEANFDDDCVAINEAAAAASFAVEVEAFQRFVQASCRDRADVQAKVDYLLNGSVGQRSPLLDCICFEEYMLNGDCLSEVFLRSLVVTP